MFLNKHKHIGKFSNLHECTFKTNILRFILPSPNSAYSCHNPKRLKFVTKLRLGLSHLREHKFKHSFQDTTNPLCSCGLDIESTEHFLLHSPKFVNERCILLITIGNINYKLLENTGSVLKQTLFFGIMSFNITNNIKIHNATKIKVNLINFCVSCGNYFSLFWLDHNNFLEY